MKAVRRGFIKSIPILCSYLFVGMAYGMGGGWMRFDEFIMERMGYPWGENEPDKQTRRQAF